MSTPPTKTYDSYHFGSRSDLTDQQLEQLISLFDTPAGTVDSVLGGRSSVTIAQIEGLGSVVVKHYTRGGLVRYFVKHRYMKWKKTRCQIEYELLQRVRRLGVSAPEPIAYACRGGLFYKAWLVTSEIKHQQTLAELSCADIQHACSVMGELIRHVSTLISNNILHVDLHPGNVLVDSGARVFLVDFDKACLSRKNKNKLRDQYLTRWRRSVVKHRLPEMLYEIMSAGLQKNYQIKTPVEDGRTR